MKKIRVAIRAGHGGSDRKNVGPTGYVEADGNLAFARHLTSYLKEDKRFEVYNIREKDEYIKLSDGPKRAAEWKADVYMSVHSDAYTIRSRGVTIFESVDLDNKDLAEQIGKAVAGAMDIPFRGARERESTKYRGEDYYTDIDVAQDRGIPYVFLLERGFHSNPSEEAKLRDDDVVKASAVASGKVLQGYFFGDVEIIESVNASEWKKEGFDKLIEKGLLNSPEYWENKLDDNLPVWAAFNLISRI